MPDGRRPTRVRRLVLGLACGLSFLLYLHRYAWGFVKKDVQDEFGWGPVTLGWLDSLFAVTYGLGQVPAGILCDWFGARLLLGGSAVLWSLALAAIAVATGVASFAVARLAFGGAQASCYPVLSKVSKNWFPADRRPAAQGLIATLFGRGGGAAAFLLFGVLVGRMRLPWRTAVLLIAALGVVAGVLFLWLFRNTPREHPWANEAEADLITAGDAEAGHATGSRLAWSALLRSPSALLLFARAFASNLADIFYVYWVPLYFREEMGLGAFEAGCLAALPLLGGALGGLASGWLQTRLLRRTGNRRWTRAGVALSGKLAAALLMLGSLTLEHAAAFAFLFLAVKFFTDWEQAAEWGAATDLGGRNAATVFACVNTVGSLGGLVAGPLTGFILQSYSVGGALTTAGWNALFVLIAVEYLAAGLCWLFIDSRKPLPAAEG